MFFSPLHKPYPNPYSLTLFFGWRFNRNVKKVPVRCSDPRYTAYVVYKGDEIIPSYMGIVWWSFSTNPFTLQPQHSNPPDVCLALPQSSQRTGPFFSPRKKVTTGLRQVRKISRKQPLEISQLIAANMIFLKTWVDFLSMCTLIIFTLPKTSKHPNIPWKMVGLEDDPASFWQGPFSGAILVFGSLVPV